MPWYDYKCPKCDADASIMHSIKECDNIHACVECGAPMDRVLKETTFVLKGDGWHNTEYTKYRSIKS